MSAVDDLAEEALEGERRGRTRNSARPRAHGRPRPAGRRAGIVRGARTTAAAKSSGSSARSRSWPGTASMPSAPRVVETTGLPHGHRLDDLEPRAAADAQWHHDRGGRCQVRPEVLDEAGHLHPGPGERGARRAGSRRRSGTERRAGAPRSIGHISRRKKVTPSTLGKVERRPKKTTVRPSELGIATRAAGRTPRRPRWG